MLPAIGEPSVNKIFDGKSTHSSEELLKIVVVFHLKIIILPLEIESFIYENH